MIFLTMIQNLQNRFPNFHLRYYAEYRGKNLVTLSFYNSYTTSKDDSQIQFIQQTN